MTDWRTRAPAEVPPEEIPEVLGAVEAYHAELWARLGRAPVATSKPVSRGAWLRPVQAAAEYSVSVKTVYKWIYQRKIPSRKFGTTKRGPVLVARADIERLTRPKSALVRG